MRRVGVVGYGHLGNCGNSGTPSIVFVGGMFYMLGGMLMCNIHTILNVHIPT